MIHKWMEQWFDTLLFLGLLSGMLFGFGYYWENEFQIRCAEVIMQDFLAQTSVRGKITQGMMEALVDNIKNVSADYNVIVEGTKFVRGPVYDRIPKEYLSEYFAGRNQIRPMTFQEYYLQVSEEMPENLCLQNETNASLLGTETIQYVPLPGETTEWDINAVYPVQEVYEKEPLITLCCITSADGTYYVEAEEFCPEQSGTVYLNLQLQEQKYQIPVNVVCYPRLVNCKNGHTVVNTESVLRQYCQTGEISCPYCKELPVQVTCSSPVIYIKTGTELNSLSIVLDVEFMDGHTEEVLLKSADCQVAYDKEFCGIQQAEVLYRGKETVLTVISENEKCLQCEGSCNDRTYTDYLRFPYCINCLEHQEIFTYEFMEEENQILQNELLLELEQRHKVCFSAGDFVLIRLTNQNGILSILQKEIRCDGE